MEVFRMERTWTKGTQSVSTVIQSGVHESSIRKVPVTRIFLNNFQKLPGTF